MIRALKATGEFPRSRFDALTEKAQSLGAKGLAWAVVEADGTWRSPIAKFLSEDEIARANDALEATEGDAVLIVADKPAVAARVLGGLRPEVGHGAARATTSSGSPSSRRSNGTRRRSAGTRRTTRSPARPGDLDADPGTWRSRAYDVVFDGWELGAARSVSATRRCSRRSST